MFSENPKLLEQWESMVWMRERNPDLDREDDDVMTLLLACEEMDAIWNRFETYEGFRLKDLLNEIEHTRQWPLYEIDRLPKVSLEKWQKEVRELSLALAQKLKGSRIDESLRKDLEKWLFPLEDPSKFYFKDGFEAMRCMEARPYEYASEFLTQLADKVEWDIENAPPSGSFRYDSTKHVQGQVKGVNASIRRFAFALSEYFYYLTGEAKKEVVATLIYALFDGFRATENQMDAWVKISDFAVKKRGE
jgi:hypothetical protein